MPGTAPQGNKETAGKILARGSPKLSVVVRPEARIVVAAGILPAVEPWRPARRKKRATRLDAG
jgi:hypothetical protein